MKWGLAPIFAGERAAEMGLLTPVEVCEDFPAARRQPLLGRKAIQLTSLPLREGGCGLTSAVGTRREAYLGGEALDIARIVTASSGTNPSGHLDESPNLPLANALIQELKGVGGYARESYCRHAWDLVGSSRTWKAPRQQRAGNAPGGSGGGIPGNLPIGRGSRVDTKPGGTDTGPRDESNARREVGRRKLKR